METVIATDATGGPGEITWLQPYPDALLELVAPRKGEPDAIVVTKETIELAFLTVIQLLTPPQRAALILCDVSGWSAAEAATTLETTVASVNGALQRARATLRKHLPSRKEWPPGVDATAAERELVRRFVSMQLECVPTRANRQPAIAFYNHSDAMALDVIRIEDGMITEIITFPGSVFEEFGLPSKI